MAFWMLQIGDFTFNFGVQDLKGLWIDVVNARFQKNPQEEVWRRQIWRSGRLIQIVKTRQSPEIRVSKSPSLPNLCERLLRPVETNNARDPIEELVAKKGSPNICSAHQLRRCRRYHQKTRANHFFTVNVERSRHFDRCNGSLCILYGFSVPQKCKFC